MKPRAVISMRSITVLSIADSGVHSPGSQPPQPDKGTPYLYTCALAHSPRRPAAVFRLTPTVARSSVSPWYLRGSVPGCLLGRPDDIGLLVLRRCPCRPIPFNRTQGRARPTGYLSTAEDRAGAPGALMMNACRIFAAEHAQPRGTRTDYGHPLCTVSAATSLTCH